MPLLRFLPTALLGLSMLADARGAEAPVSFRSQIAPILQRRCVACHGEESAKGKYRLDSFARLGKSGESDLPPLVAGKATESELYRLLVEADANDRMPQKADALPEAEIALVGRWIKEGAHYDGGPAERPLAELVRETFLLPAPKAYSHPVPITALAFSPDGTQLAAAGYNEITLWDAQSGTLVQRVGNLPERITAIAWSPKTRLLAVAGGSPAQWGSVALIDPAKDWQVRFLCDLPEMALSVAFIPDGTQLALGSGDRTTRFFDAKTGRQTRLLRTHADWVQTVAYSPDGTHLLSSSRDRTLRVVNVATGEVESTYTGHETALLTALFSRDGKTVLSLAQAGPVQFWDTLSGQKKKETPIEIPGRPAHLAWLPTGLLSAGGDGLIRIQQLSDRQTLFTLYGQPDAVTSLAIGRTPDTFATGSYDGTICVWNLACGTWVQRFVASPR